MKIVVCIRQGSDGDINPFDASAYEAALQIRDAEIILLSMGPESTKDYLRYLTRLGAQKAVLLSDRSFAGADTLATAYTLSLAVKQLQPDLVFCGRQTLIGDTAQTGPMLSVLSGYSLITNVMKIHTIDSDKLCCETRKSPKQSTRLPALLTFERIHPLRLPRLGSKLKDCEVWSAAQLDADPSRCGLQGSPTRVLQTYENTSGRRTCTYITAEELPQVIQHSLQLRETVSEAASHSRQKLKTVWCVGTDPLDYANSICDHPTVIDRSDAETITALIKSNDPDAVIWASDPWSKQTSAQVAAMLSLGLCADCTSLETDGVTLSMIRPALAGSILAKIQSLTKPAMATVRTTQPANADIVVAAGYGARNHLARIKAFADELSADFAATRKMVDHDLLPYDLQVGLTGKTVSPLVYIAIGISGAVHHVAGMQQSGTIIAINPDRNAPVFDYADYGIVDHLEHVILEK